MNIKDYRKLNLEDYGLMPTMMPENVNATPARITAVHKERYEIICEFGQTFGRLKKAYIIEKAMKAFLQLGILYSFNIIAAVTVR